MADAEPDTKQRILAAAEAEFLARGYDRARMQSIADRAQINKSMLHYHFRSKDELFAQIFRTKASLLYPRVEAELRSQSNFIAFTCGFVDAYLALLAQNPFLPSFLLQVCANHLDLLEQVEINFPSSYVRAFEGAVSNEEIRPLDARQFLVSLMGMCVMPFIGKNLVKGFLHLEDADFDALLQARAEELKRYVVLLLTPESGEGKEN